MAGLELPVIDDRSYQALLDEAIARIPVHNPEWTNFNDSDPGITVLQLFSFMTETLLYRARLIPERNRLAFLRLLKVTTKGATPAQGVVEFGNRRGPLAPLLVAQGTALSAGTVPFRTNNGLSVLPIEVRAYVKREAAIPSADEAQLRAEYELYYASFLTAGGTDLQFYETAEVVWPQAADQAFTPAGTVDGAIWLALLARPGDDPDGARAAIDSAVLTLGVVPALDEDHRSVAPGGEAPAATARLEIHRPDLSQPLPADPAARQPTYAPVDHVASGDVLRDPGVIQVQLPPAAQLGTWSLEAAEGGVGAFPPALEGDDAARLLTWLRIRAQAEPGSEGAGQAALRLLWLGANAALAEQRTHVPAERIGIGTGEPDQRFELASTPVLLESLEVRVGGERWARVDDLLAAGPEVPLGAASNRPSPRDVKPSKAYVADRDTGQIQFGNGIHGARPGAGQALVAGYDQGGGAAGLVATGAITKGPTLPPGVVVTNPVPTWGGAEAQSTEAAEAEVAAFVRRRGQLVSAADFEAEAWQTPGIEPGRVEVLPLFYPGLTDVTVPGVVTLMVLPVRDPAHPAAPRPDRLFLDAMCAHLGPKRLVTTELYLTGPDYKPVWISVGVDVERGRDIAPVLEAVKQRVKAFLSPLPNPFAGERGWPLGTAVDRLEVLTEVARVDGVGRVVDVVVSGGGGPVASVPMTGLELPELAGLSVRRGDAGPVLPVSETVAAQLLPVPFVPEEC